MQIFSIVLRFWHMFVKQCTYVTDSFYSTFVYVQVGQTWKLFRISNFGRDFKLNQPTFKFSAVFYISFYPTCKRAMFFVRMSACFHVCGFVCMFHDGGLQPKQLDWDGWGLIRFVFCLGVSKALSNTLA